MQMVAASKMRKAQEAAVDVRPFAQLVYRIQRTATTRPVDFQPVGDIRSVHDIPGFSPDELAHDTTEFLFEPDADDIIGFLLDHYLNILVHVVLVNAKASEQSARMVSMKAATDSAVKMIAD